MRIFSLCGWGGVGGGNFLNWLILWLKDLVLSGPGNCLKLTCFLWACLWILQGLPCPAISHSLHLMETSAVFCSYGSWGLAVPSVALHWNMAKPVGESYVNCQSSVPCGPHLGHGKHTRIFCPNTFWKAGWSQSICPQSPPDCFLRIIFLRWESDTSPLPFFLSPHCVWSRSWHNSNSLQKNCFLIPKSPPWFGWGV